MKAVIPLYVILSLALVGTSLVTGRRATRLSGEPHYLLTRTRVLVERKVEPGNATDAAMNAIFEEAGESTRLHVEEPAFVLGLLDATVPAIVLGGLIVGLLYWRNRRRRRARPGTGKD